jgi:threonylcarbamoyladenosine tRNA methylthiotransferase MtaB
MKVFFDTIGCRLNQAEIEIMAAQFRSQGHAIVDDAGLADLVIVNTCAVTSAAASDSRQKIRLAARKGAQKIYTTGCWATLEPEKAINLPGVHTVVLNEDKFRLVSDYLNLEPFVFDLEPLARTAIPGSLSRTRAFIKVQDGCDNFCTFCVTRLARGKSNSRSLNQILTDIKSAVDSGVKEIVLTGVHLGAWGKDFTPKNNLHYLIEKILEKTDIPRLRLSSLEPWDLDEKFFTLWRDKRLCQHFHLPLQSGAADVLKRMARKTTPESFLEIVENVRAVVPEAAITTDMIVGFPGETEILFQETMEFIKRIEFAGGHVFPFSARPGTPAAKYDQQVPKAIRQERSKMMRESFSQMEDNYRKKFVGGCLAVLWEGGEPLADGSWLNKGLSENYLRIAIKTNKSLANTISKVKISSFSENGMAGQIIDA